MDIFQHIDVANTVLLTPNRRLSATLHKRYQQYQLALQHRYWQMPDILPITSWIERLFSDYTSQHFTASPLLLNSAQDGFIWEKIVSNAKESHFLLHVSETANTVRTAWSLLKQWQVDIHHPIFNSADDYAIFQRWATEFQQLCHDQHWIDAATLPDFIISKMKSKEIIPPQHIILIGFTEISPQLKQLLSCCQSLGSHIDEIQSLYYQHDNHVERISLRDQEEEILTIARWAKTTLTHNNTATIACVIPTLDKKRDRIKQIFSEIFEDPTLFNISAGKSLSNYPIINTALQLLSLHKKYIPLDFFSYLLASPFLGEAETERTKRAYFDSVLRQKNINQINLQELSLENYCPRLAKRIQRFFTTLEEQEKIVTYYDWALLFNQLLSVLGWPGERSLSSEEYQVVENWLALLAEFSLLDQITQPTSFQHALQALHKLISKTIFQPKTPDAPVQVLGILEAASLPFDYLWVAGMDDVSWPPQPKPNPFIPKSLQRELNMPHATAERELMFCQRLTQQFKQSAKRGIFSHAEKNDELELQTSSLLRDLTVIYHEDLHLLPYQSTSEYIYLTKEIETIIDEAAPAQLTTEPVRGGISVIKQQALCPFKAFSEWRLHAQALEKPSPGLRNKDRGTIIHKTLEIVWNQLKDHTTLNNLEKTALNELISNSIEEAFSSFPNSHHTYKHYMGLEKKRVRKLIKEWLKIEKDRTPFKVLTNEKAAQITLNQLTLSIRIDRIDELSDGKKLIIDYKTGKNNEINSWFSPRPEEPQLPLYSLLDPDNTIGLTFAQITPGEHVFKGVSRYDLDIKGIKSIAEVKKAALSSWEEQLTQWHTTLTQLSDDFCQGIAKVDPKDKNQTCLWCALKPFCRINEEVSLHEYHPSLN